ncbi:uncharacterized protein B0P05DRAFT_642312 [Gilbertella persicaria]|uniref:uncharacterized protein n=1 Tax=Gilbertella persicaria TaxID=101096 RepID=UPI0022208C8E|nr:uncharacterized protein B0P05DRAFT_642312 [Gilbertella persicaria]KAI8047441.1 hypothetical protein B0P05DRAFT_642312 [Gilbertella persicaria]
MAKLTTGAIKAIYNDEKTNPLVNNCVLQLLNLKSVQINGGIRHRVIISDGVHHMQGMLSQSFDNAVNDGTLKRYTILRLTEGVCNPLQNRRILVLLNFDVIQSDVESKIGSPVSLDNQAAAAATATASSTTTTATASSTTTTATTMTPTRTESSSYSSNQNSGYTTNMQLEANLTPIRNLNPYQTRWHIKARVSQKSPIKKWHNARGDGQLFSVNLLDQSGEIKATAFNDQVDRLYNALEEGKLYYISKARVSMARKQFSTLDNEYELSFEHGTEIEACPESGNIPQVSYNFVKIADLDKYEKGSYADVIGVVTEDAGISEIVSKMTGKPSKKRELTLVDDSARSIRLTLWDTQADEFNATDYPIIVCKGARVNDFSGRSLSVGSNSTFKINPNMTEVQHLRRWYNERGSTAQIESFTSGNGNAEYRGSNVKITLQDAKSQNLGMGDKPDYFSFRGTVVFIKNENFAYPGCPECKKKTLLEESGWRCEKCQKTFPKPEYRYILTMSVEDATSQIYLNGFDDLGLVVLKKTANELMELKENNATAAHQVITKSHFQTYNFKVRVKQETFNDLTRIKYSCVDAKPIDYVKESQELVNAIDQILA